MNGQFVISLDYELHWGVFDKRSVESYKENLSNVNSVIERLLNLSDKYGIKLTFATVGFLFAESKKELDSFSPKIRPTYERKIKDPYPLFNDIGNNENDDPFHFSFSTLKKIKDNGHHEISTHTYSHFYCHEKGQTVEQFKEDLKAAVKIANDKGIELKSIVFPRNMIESDEVVDKPYLDVCYEQGLRSFRGKEKSKIYNIHTTKSYHGWRIFKILRFLDCYINLTGSNTYDVKLFYKKNEMLNLPSSRLLRPFFPKLKSFETLKIKRIKNAMRNAAKKGELFHLWWHPHNFGKNMDENFRNLENIFKAYKQLNETYNFKSETMSSLASKIEALD